MIVAKALQGGGGDLCKMITPGVHLQQDLHSFSCATVIYINGSHAAYGSHAAKQAYWKYLGPQLPSLNNNNNNKKKTQTQKTEGKEQKGSVLPPQEVKRTPVAEAEMSLTPHPPQCRAAGNKHS